MPLTSAVSFRPSRAVPEIASPLAGSSTASTSMVRVFAAALSEVPSLTLKVKLASASPCASAGGAYASFDAPISAATTMSPAATAVPSSVRLPLPSAGSVTIRTPTSTSPGSASAKPKSPAENTWAVSSSVVTVLSEAVGTAFAATVPVDAVSVCALPSSSVSDTSSRTVPPASAATST